MSIRDLKGKGIGITPISPPDDVVRQLVELDRMRQEAARIAASPPEIKGVGQTAASIHAAQQEQMDALRKAHAHAMQQSAQTAEPRQIALLNDNITNMNRSINHLCHLLETLQLSVVGLRDG